MIKVSYKELKGLTHEFFGMGAVVPRAKDAEEYTADALEKAFMSK
jgi:acetyl esterase